MSPFQVAPEIQSDLQGSLRDNKSVKLPFGAPQLWWLNGKPELFNLAEIDDARRFGGFGISKEDIEAQATLLPPELPYHWKLFDELTNHTGKAYSAYLTRTAWVAPIVRRYRWVSFEGKNKSQVEYLCYLAVMSANKTLDPWGPVVISGSSYSGGAIDNAFKEFAQKSSTIRGTTPQNFFFHPLGSWGKSPKSEPRKGKGGKESTITPCQLYVPESGYTEEILTKWFVPQEFHFELSNLKNKAKEWVDDWAKKQEARGEIAEPEMPPVDAVDGAELPY